MLHSQEKQQMHTRVWLENLIGRNHFGYYYSITGSIAKLFLAREAGRM
jgi:hypothetical protein